MITAREVAKILPGGWEVHWDFARDVLVMCCKGGERAYLTRLDLEEAESFGAVQRLVRQLIGENQYREQFTPTVLGAIGPGREEEKLVDDRRGGRHLDFD